MASVLFLFLLLPGLLVLLSARLLRAFDPARPGDALADVDAGVACDSDGSRCIEILRTRGDRLMTASAERRRSAPGDLSGDAGGDLRLSTLSHDLDLPVRPNPGDGGCVQVQELRMAAGLDVCGGPNLSPI